MRVILLVLALALSAQAKPSNKVVPFATSPEINEYIDRVVNEIKRLLIEKQLDPMPLPDLVRDFEYTDIFGITWHGNASLTNGWLEGTTTLYRDGDVDMTYDDWNMYVAGRFTFTQLRMIYDFIAEIMDLGPQGQSVCTITDTSFEFKYYMNLLTLKSNLTYFEIFNNGNIKCEIRGLDPVMEFLTETFINLFLRVFDDTIIKILSDVIEELLQQALDNIGGFTTLPPIAAYTVPVMVPLA